MSVLELDDVSLITGGHTRLDRVCARVSGGCLIAIVGANGSGKSSLLSVMGGQLAPSSGTVTLDSRPLAGYSIQDRARQLAWLGQTTPGAEDYSVRDVISWGTTCHRGSGLQAETTAAMIETLGLTHLSAAPLGSLSGGERLRVHIARVFAQAAQFTLLDEPDASLDDAGRTLLRDAILRRVQKGQTVVMVTHERLWAEANADEVWTMGDAQVMGK